MYLIESNMAFNSTSNILDFLVIVLLILLIGFVVFMLYKVNFNNQVYVEPKAKDDNELDLSAISKELEEAPPKTIELTDYEKEQEEKAIISYDELLSNTGEYQLNYSDEETKDDLTVKKFDLEHLTSPSTVETPKEANIEVPKEGIHLLSLEKEEAFLKALKELQQSLY